MSAVDLAARQLGAADADWAASRFRTNVSLSDVAVVIPTLNPGLHTAQLCAALCSQRPNRLRVIIVDSGSTDGSLQQFVDAGFKVHAITPGEFDHGGTRNLGLTLCRPAKIVVFLTQDALPTGPDAIADIVAPFADRTVGLAYGRQLPRDAAGLIERHGRLYNYPEQPAVRVMQEAGRLGIKAVFNSNSFAAYRTSALEEIGGFPSRIIMGEDQVAAARLLVQGWSLVYEPRAAVKHSHGYPILQEFSRYFDIGVFHASHSDLLSQFGRAEAEGRRFVHSQFSYLMQRSPRLIPGSVVRDLTKLIAYRLGLQYRRLPPGLSRRLAMNGRFFQTEHA